jgi:hypothetical protein
MLKKLFFLIVLCSSFALVAQDDNQNDEEYKKKILEELGVADKTAQAKEEPAPDQEQVNGDLGPNKDQNLNENVDSAIEDLANMGGMDKEGEPIKVPVKKDVPPVKLKESYLTKMMNAQTKALVSSMMAQSPFAGMQRKELEAVFIAKNEGNPLGALLKKNEKVKNIILDVLLHEKALPNIIGLLNKPEKVKYMGIFVVVVFALAFLFNLYNSKGNLFKRILFKFGIGIGAGILNLGCFIFLFHEELTPTISIIFRYYNFG